MDTGRRGVRGRARRFTPAVLVAAAGMLGGASAAAAQDSSRIAVAAGIRHTGGGHGTHAQLVLRRSTAAPRGVATVRESVSAWRDGSPFAEFPAHLGVALSHAAGGRGPGEARAADGGSAGALRLSAAYDRRAERWLRNASAAFRWAGAEQAFDWALALAPAFRAREHAAYGVSMRSRPDVAPGGVRFTVGTELELSPGRDARSIAPRRAARTAAAAPSAHDGVAFRGLAPYVQAEAEPARGLRLTGTLRYDHVRYGYRPELDAGGGGADLVRSRAGGAAALTYAAADALELSAGWQRELRAPAEKLVMLRGRAGHASGLEPVRVDRVHARVRGRLNRWLGYEVRVYDAVRRDDVVTLTHADGRTELANVRDTRHRRLELALGIAPPSTLRLDLAYARADHTYGGPSAHAGGRPRGNEVENAPREIGSARVSWTPAALRGAAVSLEWTRVGPYWMDAENTRRYPGHDLLDAELRVPVAGHVMLLARAVHVLDAGARPAPLAPTALYGEEWAPWMRRTVSLELEVR